MRLLRRLHRAFLQHFAGLPAHFLGADAQPPQHIQRDAFLLPDQAKEQMLRADVVVAHPPRFIDSQLEHFLGAGREV